MKVIRLQPLAGFLLLAWAGISMAQNGADAADSMRKNYEALRESAPMTEEQQKMFEYKIRALELKQAWEGNYINAAGAKSALPSKDAVEIEGEVESYIVE